MSLLAASPFDPMSTKKRDAPRLVVALIVFVMSWSLVASLAQAQDIGTMAPAAPPAAFPLSPPPPPATNPALDVGGSQAEPTTPSILTRWWFWTAVGAVAAATIVVVVVSSRGHAPPATDLGNQEFQP